MLTIVYCTRQSNPEHKEHLIKSSGLQKHVEVIEIINNGESLTKSYNRGLEQAKNDIVVFCHDDITIETSSWGRKLLKQFTNNPEYGIIGVAGTKNMPSSGQWWENKNKMYGRVAHTHEGKTWLSTYSPDIHQDLEEVVIVDGVFFAVDKTKIKNKFNETVEGFHFYEITFCFENYLKGVKIGVTTYIRINHKSIGMTNESWDQNRIIFAETFKDKLPINIKKILHKGQKLKVLIGCLSLKNNTPEEKYIFDLINSIKEECEIYLTSNIDQKIGNKLKQIGVKLYSLQEPPSFKLGDGKWALKTNTGDVVSVPNTLYKISDVSFDILHINQKPVADHLLRLYPNTDTICTIHTTDKTLDEPVISPQIKKYIVVNEEIKEILIDGYEINSNLVIMKDDKKIIDEYKLILG